jgi:hypothetical protein
LNQSFSFPHESYGECVPIKKCHSYPGRQWLIPIILATQEAEIGRMVVPGQKGQKKKLRDLHIHSISWM